MYYLVKTVFGPQANNTSLFPRYFFPKLCIYCGTWRGKALFSHLIRMERKFFFWHWRIMSHVKKKKTCKSESVRQLNLHRMLLFMFRINVPSQRTGSCLKRKSQWTMFKLSTKVLNIWNISPKCINLSDCISFLSSLSI